MEMLEAFDSWKNETVAKNISSVFDVKNKKSHNEMLEKQLN